MAQFGSTNIYGDLTVQNDVSVKGNIKENGQNLTDKYFGKNETMSAARLTSGTMPGNLAINNGTNTTLSVIAADSGNAVIEAIGISQGTGIVFVGQSSTYGGGIEYNGDSNPVTSGSGSDYITLFRRSNGTDSWTMRNSQGNNIWEFRETPTVAGSNIWHSGNDGSGSGLDADLLDGVHLSSLVQTSRTLTAGNGLTGGGDLSANRTVTLGTPGTLTNSTTNSVTSTSHTHAITLTSADVGALDLTGGTITGNVTIQNTGSATLWLRADTDNVTETDIVTLKMSQDGDLTSCNMGWDEGNYFYIQPTQSSGASSTPLYYKDKDGVNYTVWHAGNDGSGSGLDADLLDGQHGSYYATATHNHTLDALSNTTISSNTSGEILKWNGTAWINNTLAEAGIAASSVTMTAGNGLTGGGDLTASRTLTLGTPGTLTGSTTNSVTSTSHTHAISLTSADVGALDLTGGTITGNILITTDSKIEWTRNTDRASISFKNTSDADADSYMHFQTGDNGNEYFRFSHLAGGTETEWFTIKSDNIRFKGSTVWHSSNDGSGSGLDADLLDGVHLSSLVQTSRAINTGSGLTGGGNLTADRTLSVSFAGTGSATTVSRSDHTHTLAALTDTSISAPATGHFLRYNGTNWLSVLLTASDIPNLDASKITSGTVADARLSGTYSGISVKLNGTNTVFSEPNTGTASALGRTVTNLAEYRNPGSAAIGAIVFIAPNTTSSIMHRFEVRGYLHSTANIIDFTVQGYRTTSTWSSTIKVNRGSIDIQVRLAVTPDGKNCLILGDVATTWSYPHISIIQAMFSHTGAGDSYCNSWTTGLITDLTGYTNITSDIPDSGIAGNGTKIDANTVDGLHAASFLRADATDQTSAGVKTWFGGAIDTQSGSGATLQVNGFMRTGNIYLHEGGNTPTGVSAVLSNTAGVLEWNGNTVWHVGNDGTGSSLDADLLDGQHGSYYTGYTDTHANSTGASHSYINQSVTTSASPTFAGLTLNGNLNMGTNKIKFTNNDYIFFDDNTVDGCNGTFLFSVDVDTPVTGNALIHAGAFKAGSNLVVDTAGKLYYAGNDTDARYAAKSHESSTGTSHSYINQSVTTSASPTFANITITGSGSIKSGYSSGNILTDHNNGHVTLSAAGGQLYLGYQNTTVVRLQSNLVSNNGSTLIADTAGKLYYAGADTDARYVKAAGDTMTGVLSISNQNDGIGFSYVSNGSTPAYRTSGSYITGGSDYAGLSKGNNINVQTWFGFSVSSTISGQTVPQGGVSFSVNARSGDAWIYNDLYVKQNKKVWHEGTFTPGDYLAKSGGTMTGRIVTPAGNDKGIQFGSGPALDTVSGAQLVIRNASDGIRFSSATDWNYDKWAGIKYDATTAKLFIGGAAGSAFIANSSPTQLVIDMTTSGAGVNSIYTAELFVTNRINVRNGSDNNAALEIGRIDGSSTPLIDFHSGATYTDYDSRIIAFGGNGTNGKGDIEVQCNAFIVNNSLWMRTPNRISPILQGYNGDSYGMGLSMMSGGFLVIGSGESPDNFISATGLASIATTERTFITSDNDIEFVTNCNTIANRVVSSISNSGTLTVNKIVASSNGTGDNISVGDDCYIGDINEYATIGIKCTDGTGRGMIRFGNGAKIGYNNGTAFDIFGNTWIDGDLSVCGWHYIDKIRGKTRNSIYIGDPGVCRLEGDSSALRLFTSAVGASDCGIVVSTDGSVSFKASGTIKHSFSTSGTKTGGSIEIEGTTYGMSPIDSPKILIEDVLFDINVEESGTFIELNHIFAKSITNYAVFVSLPFAYAIDKTPTGFTVIGYTGKVDIRIIGTRIHEEDVNYQILGGLE